MARKSTSKPTNGYRYTGTDASHWLPGVPARDLSQEEAEALGEAIKAVQASGFYEPADASDIGDAS